MKSGGGGRACCGCGICSFIIGAGFSVLIYWATFQPRQVRATVDSATLSNLTVVEGRRNNGTDDGAVFYRLEVSVNLHNPSGRAGVYYDALDARLLLARDGGASLGPANATSPTVFHQPRMSSTVVAVEFDRSSGGAVAGDVAAEVDREIKNDGAVVFELAIDARVRYKLGSIPVRAMPMVRCTLRIPVKAADTEHRRRRVDGVLSTGDKCTVKY